MLKAIVSYSKKIPVPDSEYSSQGYSLSLETEVPETDPVAIQGRLHDTFELVKSSVEQELAQGKAVKSPTKAEGPSGASREAKASNKQIKFISDLALSQGLNPGQLNARIRDQFGADSLYDLDRKQASQLLDTLQVRRKAA